MKVLIKSDHLNVAEAALILLGDLVSYDNMPHRFTSDRRQVKALSPYLVPMASLWGGKAAGFSLLSLLSEGDLEQAKGSDLHFQFTPEENAPKETITVKSVPSTGLTPRELVNRLIDEFNVPKEFHFPLFHAVRLAHAFSDPVARGLLVHMQLMALSLCLSYQHGPGPVQEGIIEEVIEVIASPRVSVVRPLSLPLHKISH